MENVILVDFEPPQNWNFISGLIKSSKMTWIIAKKISNLNRKGKIGNLKRYLKYFFFSIEIFTKRKRYLNIIAWQQFYGLFYAFFCKLFHVKKRNNLTIMTFIYKPKKGFFGKIYFKWMKGIITSKYVDRLIVFSSSEIQQYCNDFQLDNSKFFYIPLGEDIRYVSKSCAVKESNFVFSSGFSNRDFNFLCEVAKKTPEIKYIIYGDKKYQTNNVFMTDEIVGNLVDEYLSKCKLVAVPLKENRSSGQLTVLHAMEKGVPVIATNSDSMNDYIQHNINGVLCENSIDLWVNYIRKMFKDTEYYKKLSINSKKIYLENHTLKAMGENIGIFYSR